MKTKFDFGKQATNEEDQVVPISSSKIFFKTYPRFPFTELLMQVHDTELSDLLRRRQSMRQFADSPVSFSALSRTIHLSLAINDDYCSVNETRRFYPSAGARYPIEAYLICNNIEDIVNGLYHYNVKANNLEKLLEGDMREYSVSIFGTEISDNFPNFIILTGVMSRAEVKYEVNAYRFALLECGHIGQNIYLLSEEEGLGCNAVGGFDNDRLVRLLDLGEDEIPLYCFSIGKPR